MNVEINLGPFNCCIDDASRVNEAEYPVSLYLDDIADKNKKVFYYLNDSGIIKSQNLSDIFVVPMFEIGNTSNKRDNEGGRAELIAGIEFKIINMIYAIANQMDISLCLNDIVIPIKKLEVLNDDKSSGCYGWIELGIAIFTGG